jgi:hypothetical protein
MAERGPKLMSAMMHPQITISQGMDGARGEVTEVMLGSPLEPPHYNRATDAIN